MEQGLCGTCSNTNRIDLDSLVNRVFLDGKVCLAWVLAPNVDGWKISSVNRGK